MANQWIRVNPNDNDFTKRMKYLSSTGQVSSGQSSSGDESSFTPNREQQAFQDYRTVKTNEINTGLDLSTASGMEAYIWNNYSGKERDDAYATLDAAYTTKGSKFYDPYRNQATNQSYYDDLKNLGVQVPEVVTSDWLTQMAQQYQPYYNINKDSGNPNSPGTKKSVTNEQKIAYDIFKLWGDEDTTEKAENEWADMKAKVTYWAQKGLSDKEIKDKIDMKNYPTLSKMDESRKIGNIVTMNRAIGYSGDALDGVIWKARNGYGDDMDDFQAAVRSKLGQGRGDRSTAKQIAQRTVGTSEYNPYVGGSNDDDARMTMGVKSWDNEWLKAHQSEMFAAGQKDLWQQMDKELGNYEAAKKQYDILDKWVSGYNYDFDAENIRAVVDKLSADLDDRLNNTSGLYMDEIDGAGKLKSLTDMDEGRRTGKPVGLSDELNYRKEDVLAEMVQRYFLQNGQKITGEQAAYAVSHADEMDKAAAKEAEEAAKAAETVPSTTEPQETVAPETTPAPVTDPVEQILHAPETETSAEWGNQYDQRVEDYTTSHPSNGTFNNNFMVPIMNTEGARSGSLRYSPRMADGAMSTEGKKLPEQSYLNVKNGKVYTRSQLETALTNMFMGVELNEEETAAASMLVKTIPWAFRTKKKVAAPMSAWSTFENNGQPIFDALDASESGYATAKDQAQMALAFYDDAARAAASGLNIATYYKEHPEEYTDIQSIMDGIYNRRDTQLAEAAQKAEEDRTDRLATGKTIIGKLGSGKDLTADEQTFLQGVLPTGDPQERDTYLGRKSVNNEYLKSIDYDTKLSDAQDAWYEAQRATSTEINVDQFALDSKLEGITELMEQSIIFDAKLAESAGMTLEEYYKKTGSLNLEDRFRQAQEQWDAREAPENRTEEQNRGIGLYGVWAGLKMGSIDTAAGYVGFAADIAGMNNTDQHKGIKESWLEYTFGNDVSSVVEARSSYRSAVLAYADSLNESDPQRAEALRNMMYEATANGEDIFNVPFDIDLDKLERAYESLQKINAVEQEYIDTHATDFEKAAVRQWRSAVSSLEKMGISTALSFAGAPGAVAGAVAFFPGTYDSTYREEVATNGGDKTSAAVYAGISAMIDSFTEQAFLSKWYNFGGEAAQSWLFNLQKAQLAKIGPAGTAGNLAHRAAAYFLGWMGTATSETLQELGQDGISAVWDFVYHGRDINWLKDQFDFINNPEARQNLVDTVASTLMSVTFSYNAHQIFGRRGITREGDGATAFSSYYTIQDNIRNGQAYRNQEAQKKADEATLAEDVSGLTVDLGDDNVITREQPPAGPDNSQGQQPPAGPVVPQDQPPAGQTAQQDQPPAGQDTDVFGDPVNGTPTDPNALHVQEIPAQQEPPKTDRRAAKRAEQEQNGAKAVTPEQADENVAALQAGKKPPFLRRAEIRLGNLQTSIKLRSVMLDKLEAMREDAANLTSEEFSQAYASELHSAFGLVDRSSIEGVSQGLKISDELHKLSGTYNPAELVESLITEITGELGQQVTQVSQTLADTDLKFALYTMYTAPGYREDIIKNLTERYTADAITAGRLTEDADAKNAVKATEDAKNALAASQEEKQQADNALQAAQQNLDSVTANRGQEGWSPKQEIAAAKGVDTAKKQAEAADKKVKNNKEAYDRAKENSDQILDAKRESLEAEAKDAATAQYDNEAAEFTANVDHLDDEDAGTPDQVTPEPVVIRTEEEKAAAAQDIKDETDRLDSMTPEQEAAEIKQNEEALAKAEEKDESEEPPAPKQRGPIQTVFGNRLRTEAVNEKGKPALTKAQINSIERAIIADNELNDFFNELSKEDLARFVADFNGKVTRKSTPSFMRNWMATETQNRQAAESGIDKKDTLKKLRAEIRKAIKAGNHDIIDRAMEKYVEGHEDLFDIEEDDDSITIDGSTIQFKGAFKTADDNMATADDDAPDVDQQLESLLPEQQEEPEDEAVEEVPEAEETPAEQPVIPAAEEQAAEEEEDEDPRVAQRREQERLYDEAISEIKRGIAADDYNIIRDVIHNDKYSGIEFAEDPNYILVGDEVIYFDGAFGSELYDPETGATIPGSSIDDRIAEERLAAEQPAAEDKKNKPRLWQISSNDPDSGNATYYAYMSENQMREYERMWYKSKGLDRNNEKKYFFTVSYATAQEESATAEEREQLIANSYKWDEDYMQSMWGAFGGPETDYYKSQWNASMADQSAEEQPAAEAPKAEEAPKEEKPKRKRAPKKPKPVIAEEVSTESTTDSLTQNLPDDIKARLAGDKLAQAIIKQINDAQNTYNKAQADVMDDTKKTDVTALTQVMDEQKEKIRKFTESFNRRVGILQRDIQAEQRLEARKTVDRSEAKQTEAKTLLEGVAKRVQKILDKAKNSTAKNARPLNYKDTQDLLKDLRAAVDVGLSAMENDVGTGDIAKLADLVKAFAPAFDAVNEMSGFIGEEVAPGSINALNAKFIRAGKALMAATMNRNASEEGKQAFAEARDKYIGARNMVLGYARDMDTRLEEMLKNSGPKASHAYAELGRPGRRNDIIAGPETQAKQSPIRTFQRLANDLRIGHYDVDNKTIPRKARGVYHPFADAIGIKRNYANDAYVTMHEIGHAIEERTNFHGTPAMIAAADQNFISSYPAADQPHEAVAEFVRTYMMDRQSAIDVYGQATVDSFETECKSNGIWKSVASAAQEIHDYVMASVGSQVDASITNYQDTDQSRGLDQILHEGFRDTIMGQVDDTYAARDFDLAARVGNSSDDLTVRQRLRLMKFSDRQGRGMITGMYMTPDNHVAGHGMAYVIERDVNTGERLLHGDEDHNLLSRLMVLKQAKTRYDNAEAEAKASLPASATPAEIAAAVKTATDKTTVFGERLSIQEINNEIHEIETQHQNVAQSQRQLEEFWHKFMRDWMPAAGISPQTVEDLIAKYPHYCPLQRNMPDGKNGKNTRGGVSSTWAYGFKSIKGSDLDVINPLVTMQSVITKTVSAARKNEALGEIVRSLKSSPNLGRFAHIVTGDTEMVGIRAATLQEALEAAAAKATAAGQTVDIAQIGTLSAFLDDFTQYNKLNYTTDPNVLAYQENGKITLVKFDDNTLLDAVVQGYPDVGWFAEKLGSLTRNMSLLTTGMNVLFTAKNLVRDYQQGTVWGSWNSSVFSPLGLAKWVAAAVEVASNGKVKPGAAMAKIANTLTFGMAKTSAIGSYQDYKAMGGDGYGSINVPRDERTANELMRNLYGVYGMSVPGKIAHGGYEGTIGLIDRLNGVIEQTTRYVEYRYGKHDLSTAEGRAKAFLAAQDATVDFARRGNSRLAAGLRAMIPFYNASLQGTWQVFDAVTDKDQRERLAPRAAKLAVNNMILGALGYMLLQQIGSDEDKEWYEKLALGIRLDNIVIPFRDSSTKARQFIRIPVAQNWASRAFYAAGQLLARGNNGDADGMDILAIAGNILNNCLQTDFIFSPELAVLMNRSWTGSTIMSERLRTSGLKESEKYNDTTPEIFKIISRGLSQLPFGGMQISPIYIQYLAQQHSGILGQVLIPAMSPDSLDNHNLNPIGQVLRTIRNSWTIDPAYTNDINDAYYDGKKVLQGIVEGAASNGASDYLSTNLTEAQAQDAVDTAAQLTGTNGALTEIQAKIAEINKEQKKIIADPNLTAEQKEAQRRNLQREVVRLEEKGVGIINDFYETYVTGTNPINHILFGGPTVGPAISIANKPKVFLDDYRAGEEYITNAVNFYSEQQAALEGTGKNPSSSILPNPSPSVSYQKNSLKVKSYAEEDGTPIWDSYVEWYHKAYKDAYKEATSRNKWDSLSEEQKKTLLSNCNSAANKYAASQFIKWYSTKQR